MRVNQYSDWYQFPIFLAPLELANCLRSGRSISVSLSCRLLFRQGVIGVASYTLERSCHVAQARLLARVNDGQPFLTGQMFSRIFNVSEMSSKEILEGENITNTHTNSHNQSNGLLSLSKSHSEWAIKKWFGSSSSTSKQCSFSSASFAHLMANKRCQLSGWVAMSTRSSRPIPIRVSSKFTMQTSCSRIHSNEIIF